MNTSVTGAAGSVPPVAEVLEWRHGMDGIMKEIVIISGKGGTGKTSLAASFAVLADRPVIADCDVDAADLHLVLSPR